MNQNLIEVKSLTFKRGDRVIYDNLNFQVKKGKITAIMGPSGIGKTTLLKLIGGQLIPEQGEILFDGQDICRLSNSELYEVRKRMGMLFQSGALFTDISTFDNVAFLIREHTHLPESLIRQIVLMKIGSCWVARCCRIDAFRTFWWYGSSSCISTRYCT